MQPLFLTDELKAWESDNLRRELRQVSGLQGREILLNNKKVLNFCSNDYLGLAGDKRLQQAAVDCMAKEGFGSGASRLVCGNMSAHQELEQKIAQFKQKEKCLVFSTGYMANIGIISSLFGREDIIFSDKLNHASIVDGIILSKAEFKRYPHGDMAALEDLLKKASRYKKKAIITDSVFSMDGDIAPLDKVVDLAQKYDCMTMIDDAHALGVMGRNGRGLAEHFGVEDKIDIQMGTLSKAAGAFGAYVCGSKDMIDFFINKARSFIYTTGMPPAVAAAAKRGIEIIEAEPGLRKKLWHNAGYLLKGLKDLGFNTMNSQTPIIPVLIGDSNKALQFSKELLEEGIFISAIRPSTVPVNAARLRVTVTAAHTTDDCDILLQKFEKIGKKLCLN